MAESALKICIFTSVHKPFDVRVFHREAVTLAAAGYEVVLLAAADFNQEIKNNVVVKGLAKPAGRLARFAGLWQFYARCKKENSDVYHFHDFELLPIGWLLKKKSGKAVIYDCHENYPETAYERAWLPDWLRPLLSRLISWLEPALARSLDAVICVVPDQQQRLQKAGCRTVLVRNLPRLEAFDKAFLEHPIPEERIVYLGGMSQVRGAFMLVDIMVEMAKSHPHLRLLCLGPFNEAHVESAVREYAVQQGVAGHIDFHPPVPFEQVAEKLLRCKIGLIPWQPSLQTTKMVYPNKVFEYMACGLPLVASSLPSLSYIIEKSAAGLLVPPDQPAAHATAIRQLLEQPHLAAQLGGNGRRFVQQHHNWQSEAAKLLELYQQLWPSPVTPV